MPNTPFLNAAYWFAALPVPFIGWVNTSLLSLFGAMAVAGVVFRVLAARAGGNMYLAKGGARAGKFGLLMGLIGLALVACTDQQVYFFGMRFWFAIWAIIALWWGAVILKDFLVVIPRRAAAFAEKARIEKYLPKNS